MTFIIISLPLKDIYKDNKTHAQKIFYDNLFSNHKNPSEKITS